MTSLVFTTYTGYIMEETESQVPQIPEEKTDAEFKPDKPKRSIKSIVRRGTAAAAAAFMLVSGTPDAKVPDRPTPVTASAEKSDAKLSQEIAAFEERQGNRQLTFDEARKFSGLILDQARRFDHIHKTTDEINNDVFIISEDFEDYSKKADWAFTMQGSPPEIVNQQLIIQQLRDDYPDRVFTDEQLSHIMDSMSGGSFGWVEDGKIYVSLKRLNNPGGGWGFIDEKPRLQFSDINNLVDCAPATPASFFRGTLTHETGHYSVDDNTNIKSEILKAIYQDKEDSDPETPNHKRTFTNVESNGFNVLKHYQSGDNQGMYFESYLDELAVDYLTAKGNIEIQRPFTAAYANPSDFKNFELILERAGISDEELIDMHKNSRLEELLTKLAGSATNIDLPDNRAVIEFGLDLFTQRRLVKTGNSSTYGSLDWERIKEYYPFVDTDEYDFSLSPASPDKLQGCVR